MLAADIIIMADTFQYSRQSLQNRMRIRNPDGWQWVSVPLKGGQHGCPQTKTQIRQVPGWRKRHWKAILFNYSQSPYFSHYMDFIQTLYRREWISLGKLNITTSQFVYRWLGGSGILLTASQLKGAPDTMDAILDCYPDAQLIAPEGVPEPKSTHRLYFSSPDYRQTFTGFFSGMTVLDLIFNYGPDSAGILQGGTSIISAVHT